MSYTTGDVLALAGEIESLCNGHKRAEEVRSAVRDLAICLMRYEGGNGKVRRLYEREAADIANEVASYLTSDHAHEDHAKACDKARRLFERATSMTTAKEVRRLRKAERRKRREQRAEAVAASVPF